jgi:23S rRNA (pseudouridine1915-N3)-methyltransferase
MHIKIISVGKVKTRHWQQAESEYIERVQRYTDFQTVTVKDSFASRAELIKEQEASGILNKISADEFVLALDSDGQQMSSEEFAEFIRNKLLHGTNKLTFVLGGPLGLADSILKRANFVLAFSKMTLPHELCKVMLLEQIYRAFTIIRNEKYHK